MSTYRLNQIFSPVGVGVCTAIPRFANPPKANVGKISRLEVSLLGEEKERLRNTNRRCCQATGTELEFCVTTPPGYRRSNRPEILWIRWLSREWIDRQRNRGYKISRSAPRYNSPRCKSSRDLYCCETEAPLAIEIHSVVSRTVSGSRSRPRSRTRTRSRAVF